MTHSWDASTDTVTVGRGSPQESNIAPDGESQLVTRDHSNVNSVHMTTDPSNIMGSGRTHGMPTVASDWTEDTIIQVGKMDVRVGEAVMIGLLEKTSEGYRPTSGGVAASEGQSNAPEFDPMKISQEDLLEQQQNPVVERLDDQSEAILDRMTNNVSATTAAVAVEAVLAGELNDTLAGTIAGQMGIEPDQVHAEIEHVRTAFEGQAVAAVEGLGVPDGAAFFAHLAQSDPSGYNDMVKAQIMHGTVGQYGKAAFDYLVNLDTIDPQAIFDSVGKHGDAVRQVGNQIVVKVPGVGEVTWSTAVREGWVNFTRTS